MTYRDAYKAYYQYVRIASKTGYGINPGGINHDMALANYSAIIKGNEAIAYKVEDIFNDYCSR